MRLSDRVLQVYETCGRNKAKTAARLGLSRSTVAYHLKKHGDPKRRAKHDDAAILAALDKCGGNKAAAARKLKIPRAAVQDAVRRKDKATPFPCVGGRLDAPFAENTPTVPRRGIKRYIVTSAQNNSLLHAPFWANIKALADHYDADILVSRYTYNRAGYAHSNEKPRDDADGLWYPPEIVPHLCDERRALAPGLIFCGELNILPTAVSPLSGLETYTGPDSCIVPHAKLSLLSAPGSQQGKLLYTTGTVTMRNYLQRKAGQKAEFHHAYAALLVEVDKDGDWFVRQLNASDDGTFHDLNLMVKDGKVTKDVRLAALSFGDIHVDRLEAEIFAAIWSDGGMVDQLQPEHQVFHDVYDHHRRNHHDRGNPHLEFSKYVAGATNVRDELAGVGGFLLGSHRIWAKSVVVASNHDDGLTRWLREADFRSDPENACLLLEGNLAYYQSIEERGVGANIYLPEWGMRLSGDCPPDVIFLRRDESYIVNGVELGMHGDKGPNGYKGSPAALKRMGRKAITGHTHQAAILDGLYVVGVTGKMRMGYNVGPSSWTRTHCALYQNGKRSLITMRGTKWRA